MIVLMYLLICAVAAIAVLGIIQIGNSFVLRSLGSFPAAPVQPFVSVLIPARNEEKHIGPCLDALLAQDYPSFEVIVLDDNSTDGTSAVLAQYAKKNRRIRWAKGKKLPSDWIGKCFACHQLSEKATGDLLLFVDADTRHTPSMISASVNAMTSMQADMLTGFPLEEAHSFGEKLIMPLVPWGIFSALPLPLAFNLRLPMLSISVGQYLLFTRTAYRAIGGHVSVKDDATEDMQLGRLIKKHGLRWRFVDAHRHIRCRMYSSLASAVDGLTKSLFGAVSYSVLTSVLLALILVVTFCLPLVTMALSCVAFFHSDSLFVFSAAIIGLSTVLWLHPVIRFGMPWYVALFFPVTSAVAAFIFIKSMITSIEGRLTWKGRTLVRHKFHA